MTTVFEFIRKEVSIVDSAAIAQEELQGNQEISLVLVSLANPVREQAFVSFLAEKYPSLPVHKILDPEIQEPVQDTPPGFTSVMRLPVDNTVLMEAIRKAELARHPVKPPKSFVSHSGTSAEILEVQALIRHVSQADANVLLLGESGTGKEIAARSIHEQSRRAEQPFIAVNCGAIPPELLESELFGHEKGAFTGAISSRRGRFELAEGGTLFLDEIGDMPISMQVKLLRVIQERAFERVGGTKTIKSNVRLIAATHQNLEKSIEEGKFRTDLFYRLNVFPIKLPPLRQRPSDIPLLLQEFALKMQQQSGSIAPVSFDPSAIEALARHPLPGNVRELENLVERLSIMHPGEVISYDKLPPRYQTIRRDVSPREVHVQISESVNDPVCVPANSAPVPEREPSLDYELEAINLKQMLTSLEKNLIFQALDDSDWVVSKAAKALSLRRTTLIQKIRKLGIRSDRYQDEALSA